MPMDRSTGSWSKGSAARWSPDGKRLLYLAEGEPKGTQIFVRWVDADGPATQVTHVTETPRNAQWSPDGKSIAFSMFVPEQDKWAISMPAEPKGAKWTPAPRVVSTLHYRQDQVGFLEDGYTHLFVVPADGGTRAAADERQVERRRRRAARRRVDRLDARQQVDRVRRQPHRRRRHAVPDVAALCRRRRHRRDSRSGREARRVGQAGGLARRPHCRVHRLRADRTLAHGQRSVRVPLTGGGATCARSAATSIAIPINLRWAPDGTGVYFDADDRGSRNVQFACDRRRRQAGHDRHAHADVRLGVEGPDRGRHRPPISIIRRTSSGST